VYREPVKGLVACDPQRKVARRSAFFRAASSSYQVVIAARLLLVMQISKNKYDVSLKSYVEEWVDITMRTDK
jgi:hypothetical protein